MPSPKNLFVEDSENKLVKLKEDSVYHITKLKAKKGFNML